MKPPQYLLIIVLLVFSAFKQRTEPVLQVPDAKEVLFELRSQLSISEWDSLELFTLYSQAAQRLVERGNYKEADSLFIKAKKLSHHEPDSSKIIEMYLSEASMQKDQSKFTTALQTYMSALTFYKERNDVNGQLWVYGYLSEFYRATGNAELCLKFIEEGERLLNSSAIEISPRAYLSLGKAAYYMEFFVSDIKDNFENILAHSREALKLAEESGDLYLIGLNQNSMGFLLMHNPNSAPEEVVSYLESAKDNILANKRYRNYTIVLHNLALYHTRRSRPDLAVDMTLEAIALSKKNGWTSILGDMYRLAGEVYFESGKYQQSATYLNEALWTKLDAAAQTHSIELGELTASYDKNLAEQKLLEQQVETSLARQQADSNRKALITTVIVSFIFLIVAVISVILYLRFRRANQLLRTQEELMRKTNRELNNVVEQKNVLYKELNHRVKNNLTILSGLIYLQEDNEQIEAQRELYQILRQRIQSMALVHQNLYQLDDALNINFQEYLRQLIPEIASAFGGDSQVNTKIQCDDLTVDMDEAVPLAMVINEFITNSFKYAFNDQEHGTIELRSQTKDNKRWIHYRDNGPGMPEETEDLPKQKLGMMLISLMVEQLKGKLINKGDENGLYFLIELPPA
ncbi:MAG: sensor histidine kinase [Roseivirga sp.]|nr:sensor histidine kinase [Roseivirga sp.]